MLARNVTRGTVVAGEVRAARSWRDRLFGLMLRPALRPGEGLWIEPCQAVHTHFMRFAVDVLFLDAGGRVVAVVPGMRPWRVSRFHRAARAVLELREGAIALSRTQEGDRVSLER